MTANIYNITVWVNMFLFNFLLVFTAPSVHFDIILSFKELLIYLDIIIQQKLLYILPMFLQHLLCYNDTVNFIIDAGHCAELTKPSPYGYFTWIETEVGYTRCQPCSYSSDCKEVPTGSVMRMCGLDGTWGDIMQSDTCFTDITYQLQCIFAKVGCSYIKIVRNCTYLHISRGFPANIIHIID